MTFRKVILTLHLVGGLVAAIFLILLGLTGALLVFENEINHWLNPKLTEVQPVGERLSLNALTEKLERSHPGYKVSALSLSAKDDLAFAVFLDGGARGGSIRAAVNQYTGEELGDPAKGNQFMQRAHQFHTHLLLGEVGGEITGWSSVFLLGLSVSGLILWWPRKLWKFTGRRASRFNFDLHNVLGLYSSIFLFLFGLTGVVIHFENQTARLINRLTGSTEPQPVKAAAQAAGAQPLGPDALLAVAIQTVPGAQVTFIQGLGNVRNPVRVIMKYPEDGTPAGRTIIYIDPVTGNVLSSQPSRTASWGFRVVKLWNREIHTGDIYGWPTRILACLMSLALPVLAVTGPLIWWGRQRRKWGARADG